MYFHANVYSYIVPNETICNKKCSKSCLILYFNVNVVSSRDLAAVIILDKEW